jgi:ubiquinone/menaquinone biosynthesis C-methylase UbiE
MSNPDHLEPKELVRESYNHISHTYRGDSVSRDKGYFRWQEMLTPLLHPDDPVLDLGCGCGIPVAQELAQTFRVTGVDISEVQISRAKSLVPDATFLCADITTANFPSHTYAAIVSFFAIIHIPLQEQQPIFESIFRWLSQADTLWLLSDARHGLVTKKTGMGRACIGAMPMRTPA